MMHNNIGLCLVKMYENKEDEKPSEPAEEKKDDGLFTFAKNKKANTAKDKANI